MDQKDTAKNTQTLDELRARAMKVTEALYRTTDLFSDAEPLKWSLRDSAVKILNAISDISNQPTYQELRSIQTLERMIESLCFKLDLAVGGTFVARANFDVLEREYKSLGDKISRTDFFSTPLLEASSKNKHQSLSTPTPVPVESNDNESSIMDISDKRTLVVHKSPIDVQMSDIMQRKKEEILLEKKQNIAVLSERKGAILKLIKERGPSSVGDMRKLIDISLSEKTIQRDLNALADAGALKREGEKRWRRYFV